MFRGNHSGRKITSGGSAGMSSHDHSPNSASHMRVNTRVRSNPPDSRTNWAARRMWAASGGSPASRSAT